MQLTQSRLGKVEPHYKTVIAQSQVNTTKNKYIRDAQPKIIPLQDEPGYLPKKRVVEINNSQQSVEDPAVAPPADSKKSTPGFKKNIASLTQANSSTYEPSPVEEKYNNHAFSGSIGSSKPVNKSVDFTVQKFSEQGNTLGIDEIKTRHKDFLKESESYEQQFSEIVRQLNERRENKNLDFYGDHLQEQYQMLNTNQPYRKSVDKLTKNKEKNLKDQKRSSIMGPAEIQAKRNSQVQINVKMATKNPLKFMDTILEHHGQ